MYDSYKGSELSMLFREQGCPYSYITKNHKWLASP